MTISNLTCFSCGGKGHVERECPNRQLAAGPMDTAKAAAARTFASLSLISPLTSRAGVTSKA